MKVTYVSSVFNSSGYSDAARNNIMALSRAGMAVEIVPLNFEEFKSDLGDMGHTLAGMVCHKPEANIQIIHTTPHVFEKFIDSSKYNIGYTAWETSRLPSNWVGMINKLNEVWVPSTYNLEVFKNSGVTVPIQVMSHTFNVEMFEKDAGESVIQEISEQTYAFYSIFQFTERKNPLALLKAYLTEFRREEDVCLILKTYLFNPNNMGEKDRLKDTIVSVKEKLRLDKYPKIMLIANMLSKPKIHALHQLCDCYISTHRGEGFNVVCAEAMMAANPVIATDYSGSTDFLTRDTGYPISYQLTPVYGMPWEAYRGDQVWAEINIMELRERMRWVYENRLQAAAVGIKAKQYVKENLCWEKIGTLMRERLEAIHA